MAWARLRHRILLCVAVGALLLCANAATADTIILKNGNVVTGRILEERDGMLRVSTGSSELTIPASSVESIDRGFAGQFIQDRANKSMRLAQEQAAKGNNDDARRTLEAALSDFDAEAAKLEELPAEYKALRERLDQARRALLPRDPNSQRAEQLYQDALKALDYVQYEQAFAALREAFTLDRTRGDIAMQLARLARKLNDEGVAIDAYRAALETEPESYYTEASVPLLELLKTRGQKLSRERKADEAVELYKEVLLLEGAGGSGPVDVGEFLARRTIRAEQPEELVLMEVYRYADSNDLVDIAFAAATKVEKLKPNDPDVKRMVAESGFLSRYRSSIASGDIEGAARLRSEAPQDLLASPAVARRLESLAGEKAAEIEAQTILDDAQEAFDGRDYATARDKAKRVVVDFSKTAAAGTATRLMSDAEREIPIREKVARALELLERAKDEDAAALLAEIVTLPGFDKSVQRNEVEELIARIPREKTADEQWLLAKEELDREKFDEAMARLESLAADYGETRSGRKAAAWLNDYRQRLVRETRKYHPVDTDFFAALTDPNLWRAADDSALRGRDLKAPPVADSARAAAFRAFDEVTARDAGRPDGRSPLLLVGLPLLLGGLAALGILFRHAAPGGAPLPERLHPADAEQGKLPEGYTTACRVCGQYNAAEDLLCHHCGAAVRKSQLELEREEDAQRRANADPWDIRVREFDLNQFYQHFDRAKQLAETSDVQAAIENCRRALHEDPHNKAGYELLASLYERIQNRAEADECYRELLILDPRDAVVRQKLEASLKAPAINPGRLGWALSGAFWWLVLFLAIGFDPQMIVLRIVLCALGFAAGGVLLTRRLRSGKAHVPVRRFNIDDHRPLPKGALSWAGQNELARAIASAVAEHTGIDVPALTVWRVLGAAGLSIALLAAMVAAVWLGASPLILIGWPAGAFLLAYVLEIHPRVVTAHVLMRHTLEETLTPWVDPHRPFEPKGVSAKGEFLVNSPGELPLRWAMNPRPYPSRRDGILQSLQMVLNRHWSFHQFYTEAAVVRDMDVPMPGGMRMLGVALAIALLVAGGGAGWLLYGRATQSREYSERLRIGYSQLLEGDVGAAGENFYRAMALEPDRAAPHLYLGHAFAAAHLDGGAGRAFRLACERAPGLPAAHNDYGNWLQRQGRLREAIGAYSRALEGDTKNADVLNNLGSAHFKLKEFEKAAEYLARATAAEPRHTRAHTTLGLVLEELGRADEARAAYTKAVEVAPDVAYTQVAKDRLAANLAAEDKTPLVLPDVSTPPPAAVAEDAS